MSSVGAQLPPLSLYIHIPWCVRKCPYCDFNSHAQRGDLPEAAYIAAMLEDLDQDLDYIQGRELASIFIGGGTPSLFSANAYAQLFEGLRQRLRFSRDIEITLEANPGTLEQGRFAAYRELGINRLSIGVQSFDAEQLEKLGRIHSAGDALAAIASARDAGYDNFNIDLMHGLSGQTEADALNDLRIAIDSGAPHISWYQLTIEANTEFYKRPPELPQESALMTMQRAGFALLSDAGLTRYEVSAFARDGRRARHNLNYWRFGDYLALGAGAHGKVTLASGVRRYQKTRKPEDYLSRSPSRTSQSQGVIDADLPFEFMMNALRLRGGVESALYSQRTGLPLAAIAPTLERLQARGLLIDDPQRIACSERGFAFIDSILSEFLEG
ncbi:radical SAM family heme chaperone HemW [Spongiibacter sp. UBA1325]|uniref:radical SAM family heme chaperone HemW n=1 Tax=Spongiibacter sp. UBA1325 TaxID=1947543 RepID=UPI00257D3677|nr:radical SAM family heme chaperone HemW [Spongiibacter sp. UBA1325]|tara:strand:- start:11087 stop:12238 length:1152 start_codon:yes stop_codon:yes gene_type:complete